MNLKMYVDDMLIKLISLEDHLANLGENFLVMKHNKVIINLLKYAFRVLARKFLVFMLIERGIKVNLIKCRAILEMRSPTIVNEVQRLNGWIVALSRFMSKSTKRYPHFYKILKRDKAFTWDEDCKQAFTRLKEYLSSSPILTKLEVGETLFLYITTSDEIVGIVLIIERNANKKLVYYTSKVLQDVKVQYPKIEILAYIIVLAS